MNALFNAVVLCRLNNFQWVCFCKCLLAMIEDLGSSVVLELCCYLLQKKTKKSCKRHIGGQGPKPKWQIIGTDLLVFVARNHIRIRTRLRTIRCSTFARAIRESNLWRCPIWGPRNHGEKVRIVAKYWKVSLPTTSQSPSHAVFPSPLELDALHVFNTTLTTVFAKQCSTSRKHKLPINALLYSGW